MIVTKTQLRKIILFESRSLLLEANENKFASFFNNILKSGLKEAVDSIGKESAAKFLGALKGLKNYPKEIFNKIKGGKEIFQSVVKILKAVKKGNPKEIEMSILKAVSGLASTGSNIGIDSIMTFFVLAGPGQLLVKKLSGPAKDYLQKKINYVIGGKMLENMYPGVFKIFKAAAEKSSKSGALADAFDNTRGEETLKRIMVMRKNKIEESKRLCLAKKQLRKLILEITSVPSSVKKGYINAMLSSKFWMYPNYIDDVDIRDDSDYLFTPASKKLEIALNKESERQKSPVRFIVDVSDWEEEALGPSDTRGDYPNNWYLFARYLGPNITEGKGHIVYIHLRSLSDDYNMSLFNFKWLVNKLSQAINHELIHYYQLLKQAKSRNISHEEAGEIIQKDPRQVQQEKEDGTLPPRHHYLGLHSEIDAHSHQAAEELLYKHGFKKSLDLLRYRGPELTHTLKDYINSMENVSDKKLNRFFSKVYQNMIEITKG